jgi:hypothetical protein
VTETPFDAAVHAFSPPRIKFLHRTVTKGNQYEMCSSHSNVVEDSGLLEYDAVISQVVLNVSKDHTDLIFSVILRLLDPED